MINSGHKTVSQKSELLSILPVAMKREIQNFADSKINVTVGSTYDKAYESPDQLREIYQLIDQGIEQFSEPLKTVRKKHKTHGFLSLLPVPSAVRINRIKKVDKDLLPYRKMILYDRVKGLPWHQQRGCATALLTISVAHELSSESSEGIYQTMSGPLDSAILNYSFDEKCTTLDGLSLRDSIIMTERKFNKRTLDNATKYADKKLYRLEQFVHAPNTNEFKSIVSYCTDSLGIRSRAEEVADAIRQNLLQREDVYTDREVLIMSFGCGTAWPILKVMKELRDEHKITSRIILLDQDPIALAAASLLASKLGLANQIEMHCEKLFSKLGQPIDMRPLLRGRKLDIYEDSGLREYLPDRIYKLLTKAAWVSLAPGGLNTTGNMNVNRPQAEFLDGLMGWIPHVRKRTIKHCLDLHRKAKIPRSATRVRVTRDGVYSLYFSTKPY